MEKIQLMGTGSRGSRFSSVATPGPAAGLFGGPWATRPRHAVAPLLHPPVPAARVDSPAIEAHRRPATARRDFDLVRELWPRLANLLRKAGLVIDAGRAVLVIVAAFAVALLIPGWLKNETSFRPSDCGDEPAEFWP